MAKKNKDTAPAQAENTENVEAEAVQAENAKTDSSEQEKTDNAVSELERKLAEEHDRYLRLAAEYDNYRKRSVKERDAIYADTKAETVTKLLPVYDNLERALAQSCSDEAYAKGVEMTMTQLKTIFGEIGVKEIPAVGEQFDPTRHNAVMHIEDEKLGTNVIAAEFAKGFTLGEKVIRFSMVQVAN